MFSAGHIPNHIVVMIPRQRLVLLKKYRLWIQCRRYIHPLIPARTQSPHIPFLQHHPQAQGRLGMVIRHRCGKLTRNFTGGLIELHRLEFHIHQSIIRLCLSANLLSQISGLHPSCNGIIFAIYDQKRQWIERSWRKRIVHVIVHVMLHDNIHWILIQLHRIDIIAENRTGWTPCCRVKLYQQWPFRDLILILSDVFENRSASIIGRIFIRPTRCQCGPSLDFDKITRRCISQNWRHQQTRTIILSAQCIQIVFERCFIVYLYINRVIIGPGNIAMKSILQLQWQISIASRLHIISGVSVGIKTARQRSIGGLHLARRKSIKRIVCERFALQLMTIIRIIQIRNREVFKRANMQAQRIFQLNRYWIFVPRKLRTPSHLHQMNLIGPLVKNHRMIGISSIFIWGIRSYAKRLKLHPILSIRSRSKHFCYDTIILPFRQYPTNYNGLIGQIWTRNIGNNLINLRKSRPIKRKDPVFGTSKQILASALELKWKRNWIHQCIALIQRIPIDLFPTLSFWSIVQFRI